MNEYLQARLASLGKRMIDDAKEIQSEGKFLIAVARGAFPDAYLTEECDSDEILVLFPGDLVHTKYCDEVTISRIEPPKIYFEEWANKPEAEQYLLNHRLSSVIKPGKRHLECIELSKED